MNLANMTREQLWALEDSEIWELFYTEFKVLKKHTWLNADDARQELEDTRLVLQQSAAEARQER